VPSATGAIVLARLTAAGTAVAPVASFLPVVARWETTVSAIARWEMQLALAALWEPVRNYTARQD